MINYREIIIRQVRDFDPSIDVSDNSPFVSQVVDPLVQALKHDPFAVNISRFIRARIRQEHGITIHSGSFLEDILDKGIQTILEPYRREIQRVSLSQSFLNRKVMSDRDIEALAANSFVSRNQGSFSYVTIRAYYNSAVDDDVQADNVARSRGGLLFVPTRAQSITRTQMALQKEGSLYYWDLFYVASEPGDRYDIEKDNIASIDGLAAVKVINLARGRGGQPQDSNVDLILRSAQANAQATLTTHLGIPHTLSKQFASLLKRVDVVGHGHPLMQRDLIEVDGDYFAEILTYGSFPLTLTATDVAFRARTQKSDYSIVVAAGAYATAFALADAINAAWLAAGGYGWICLPWKDDSYQGLRFVSDGPEKGESSELTLLTVSNDLYDKLFLDTAFSTALTTVVGTTYNGGMAGTVSLAKIPGGIVDEVTPEGSVLTPARHLHIGAGATDIFVLPTTTDTKNRTIDFVEHAVPDTQKDTLDTTASTDWVEISSLADWEEVPVGALIAIYSGVDAGTYRVLQKSSSSGYKLRLDTSLTTTLTNVVWAVVHRETVTCRLYDPSRVLARGNGFSATAASNTLSSSLMNFTDIGVTAGDRVDVEGGDNEGEYVVVSVSSSSTLILDRVFPASDAAMTVRIVRPSLPVELPIRDISTIERVDATGRPTGSYIPYALPVDIRVVESFGNLSVGLKSATDTISTTANSQEVTCAGFASNPPAIGDRICIYTGPNKGFYRVTEIVSSTIVKVDYLMTTTESGRSFEYGSPSVGVVRLFFRDPTSFESWARMLYYDGSDYRLREGTLFSFTDPATGEVLDYEPGDLAMRRVPGPSDADLATLDRVSTSQVISPGDDFNLLGVRPGDILEIDSGAHPGTYTISAVNKDTLTVVGTPFTNPFLNVIFSIRTPFTQGTYSTSMADSFAAPFYFLDVELVSVGTGDVYNRDIGESFTLKQGTPFYKEGWEMSPSPTVTTYSLYEKLSLGFTPTFLERGMPEQRTYNTAIQGSSIRITYDSSVAMTAMDDFVRYSKARSVCQDPLVRYFCPVFVFVSFTYRGLPSLAVVLSQIKAMIEQETVEEITSYQIQTKLRSLGVTDVTMPLEIICLRWGAERTLDVVRSTDRVTRQRNECFLLHPLTRSNIFKS